MTSQVPTGWGESVPLKPKYENYTERETTLILEAFAAGKKDERKRLAEEIESLRKTPANELRESVADIHNTALDSVLNLLK